MRKLKVAYLVWNENVYKSNIFNNQVFDQIIKIKEAGSVEIDLTLIISFPLTAFLMRKYSELAEVNLFFNELKQQLALKKINIRIFKSYLAFNFNTKFFLLPFQYLENFFKTQRAIINSDIQILHCRSYHAALVGLMIKRKNKNIKLIFDTRGRFPEEGIFRNSYASNSLSYKIWKFLERKIIAGADVIVNVSDTFGDIIEESYPLESKGKNVTIYTSSDVSLIGSESSIDYSNIKRTNALVFVGELSEKGGYSIDKILETYSIYRSIIKNPHLVLITNTNVNIFREMVDNTGFSTETSIFSTTRFKDTYDILTACKFGFAALNDHNESLLKYLAPTIIAAKTGDYLCAGLPLIYDERIGGVADLIHKFGLGITVKYPLNEPQFRKQLILLNEGYANMSFKCTEFARNNFSSELNAEKYLDIYRQILK